MSTSELPSAPFYVTERPVREVSPLNHVKRLLWLRTFFGSRSRVDAEDDADLVGIVEKMTEYVLPAGATLYEKGSVADSLLFIVHGAVSLGARRFDSGSVVGFIDCMLERPHAQSALVVEEATLLRLKAEDWFLHLEDHFGILRRMAMQAANNEAILPDNWPPDDDHVVALTASEDAKGAGGLFVRQMLALRTARVFRRAGIQSLAQLTRLAHHSVLEPGQQIGREHVLPGLWSLVSGEIELRYLDGQGAEREITLGPGQLVGGLAWLFQVPEQVSIRALREARLMRLDQESYFGVMEDHFDLARSMMAYLAFGADVINVDSQV